MLNTYYSLSPQSCLFNPILCCCPFTHSQLLTLFTTFSLSKFLLPFKLRLKSLHPECFPCYSRSQFRAPKALTLSASPKAEWSMVVYWMRHSQLSDVSCVLPHCWLWIPQGWLLHFAPCVLITACPNTARWYFPLSVSWNGASPACWSPAGLPPLASALLGARDWSREMMW